MGAAAEELGSRIVRLSQNASIPQATTGRMTTIYMVSGQLTCEFRHPKSRLNEQIALSTGQWVEFCAGLEYSLRSRDAATVLFVEEQDGAADADP